MDYEKDVMELIAAAGDNKDKAFAALDELKNGDIDAAKDLIKQAKEADIAAHNVQTKLISAEMDPEKESVPMTLLMAHAQDHYMTSQLARDLIERFIDVLESQGNGFKKKNELDNVTKDENIISDSNENNENAEFDADIQKRIAKAKVIANNSNNDKMNVLLCCAGGFSTNLLMQEMKKVVINSDKLNEENFDFIAIPVDELEREIDKWDIVLIGPQVGHKLQSIKKLCEKYNKPYQVIDKDVYGSVDGATVVKMAIVLYRKKKLEQ